MEENGQWSYPLRVVPSIGTSLLALCLIILSVCPQSITDLLVHVGPCVIVHAMIVYEPPFSFPQVSRVHEACFYHLTFRVVGL